MSDENKPTTIQFRGRVNLMFERIRLAQEILPTKQGLADWLVEQEFKRRCPNIHPATLKSADADPAAEGGGS